MYRSGVPSFFAFDQQASTRELLSVVQSITDAYLYTAFGEEVTVSGTTENPLRYVGGFGYWRDAAKRIYVENREVDVTLGRWLSRDKLTAPMRNEIVMGVAGLSLWKDRWYPIQQGESVSSETALAGNRYLYVKANPVRTVDPLGLGPIDCLRFMYYEWKLSSVIFECRLEVGEARSTDRCEMDRWARIFNCIRKRTGDPDLWAKYIDAAVKCGKWYPNPPTPGE